MTYNYLNQYRSRKKLFSLNESQFRTLIRRLVVEETNAVPGDAPPNEQVHVFDFDDTLGVTKNANGIMLIRNGEPAHKTKQEAEEWIEELGLTNELLPGPNGGSIEKPEGLDGFAAYITSTSLPRARVRYSKRIEVTPTKPTGEGDYLWVDYTPSSSTTGAEPIDSTIDKLKRATAAGSETMVMTARAGESGGKPGYSFSGEKVVPSNEKDITQFLKSKGASPTKGVVGLTGANKGAAIKDKFLAGDDMPEEIHFYDDDEENIDKVRGALTNSGPEVYLYGPGHFSDGSVSAEEPKESIPAKKAQKEGFEINRWARLAGLIKG